MGMTGGFLASTEPCPALRLGQSSSCPIAVLHIDPMPCCAMVGTRYNRAPKNHSNQPDQTGPDVHITEVVATPNPFAALLGCLVQVSLNLLLLLWPMHVLLRLAVPKPHGGPSRAAQLLGHWKSVVVGKGLEHDGRTTAPLLYAILGDARDPGYWHTARVVLEAGLCLTEIAKGRAQGPELAAGGRPGGVLTPASAMGNALITRLRRAGVTMVVREPELPQLSARGAPVGTKSGPATGVADKEE